MLIRSQGKMGIVNLDCVEAVGIEKDNTIRAYGNDRVYELGEYSTEEKAIKVLDMIQSAYAKCESVKALSNGTMVDLAGKFNQKQSDDFINDHRATFVFQMPQDDEVEVKEDKQK